MKKLLLLASVMLLCATNAMSYKSEVWVSDQGNGTYLNPILEADYSDPDVIRVGDDYYMTASSFNCVPGLPILHSKDLVNWQLINYALTDLNMEGVVPANFFNTPQHGRGVWAPCIRFHKGEFMIYWGDPDFGIYVVKTKNVLGRWDSPILVMPGKGRIDPSPLFDDDGRVYLVHAWAASRAKINSLLTMCELNSDGTKVVGQESLIYDGLDNGDYTIEGSKFHKHNGYYYVLAPAGGVETGWQIALRSKSVTGPYEMKRVMAQGKSPINGPHQGGLVDTQSGEWWFIHFQDKELYGRVTLLQPVEWKDGWPVMGVNARDYCGEPVVSHKKPNVGKSHPIVTPVESDEFNTSTLGLQWSWHANPQQTWGYPSTHGYFRMFGQYYPEGFVNFWAVPNLLMQKFPAPSFTATTKTRIVLQNEGDKAGLIVMGLDYSYIAFVKSKNGYELEQVSCYDAENLGQESETGRVALSKLKIEERHYSVKKSEYIDFYYRVEVAHGGVCTFSYSVDGKSFVGIGKPFQAKQGKWIGAKVGMFVMNKTADTTRSWLDMDWFRVEKAKK